MQMAEQDNGFDDVSFMAYLEKTLKGRTLLLAFGKT